MKPCCQSCGMPMKQDPEGGGSEADGSRSHQYCSLCYRQGAFIQADLSASEMQAFCVDKLVEQGTPRWLAWLFTRGIPRLSRWS